MSSHREGIVQLGDLTAYARWTNGYFLSIQFPTHSFRRDQWQAVDHLQHCPHPLSLVCDGKATSDTRIIGYEKRQDSVTFHVALS
jgi:hypothetical protein